MSKKRPAEFQLTSENCDAEDVVVSASDAAPAPTTSSIGGFGAYASTNPFAAAAARPSAFAKSTAVAAQTGSIGDTVAPTTTDAPPSTSAFGGGGGGGFGAYAKINPFAAASLSGGSAFTTFSSAAAATAPYSSSSSSSSSSFGLTIAPPSSSTTSGFGAVSAAGLSSFASKAPPAVMIPPSPRSPKANNPFSKPSPKVNPFVSIVESKDNLWNAASRSGQPSVDREKDDTAPPDAASSTGNKAAPVFTFPSSSSFGSSSSSTKMPRRGSLVPAGGQHSMDSMAAATAAGNGATANDDDDAAAAVDDDADGDEPKDDGADGDQIYGKIYPMPENVTVVTGEENETCVLQVRAKLFRLDVPGDRLAAISRGTTGVSTSAAAHGDGHGSIGSSSNGDAAATALSGGEPSAAGKGKTPEWVEVGIGPVRLLTPKSSLTQSSLLAAAHSDGDGAAPRPVAPRPESARLVMRREDKKGGHGTKLLLNTLLKGYINVAKQGDRMFRITCVSVTDLDGAGVATDGAGGGGADAAGLALRTYMIKTKAQHEADDLFQRVSRFIQEDSIQRVAQNTADTADTADAADAGAADTADSANAVPTADSNSSSVPPKETD